MSINKFSADQ